MKILDRYILTTYLKTFFSVFVVFLFIFILQGIWLYIAELAGKDLDISVTIKFLIYMIPRLIPTVVPLTILLTSIMVFGRFAENYEFAAMKSTGISLQRAMRSLSVFIVILAIGCFFFSNNVIPWGEFKFHNLRVNLKKTKPALAIVEGQFNEFGNINIKVDKKHGEEGKLLDNVVIHERSGGSVKNNKVIVAKKGELKSSLDSNILQLLLIDGNYYEEILPKENKKKDLKPHLKSYFQTYTINIDLEALNNSDFDSEDEKGNHKMLNINQLSYTIDSLKTKKNNDFEILSANLLNRSNINNLNANLNIETNTNDNSINKTNEKPGDVLDMFNPNLKTQILNAASNTANSTLQILKSNANGLDKKNIYINKHIIALHDKYVLAVSCIVLFFLGAPLGAIIRKGGLGLPIVVAVILFLSYFFLGILFKNSAEKGGFNPVFGAWLATLIMLPFSIYLTRRATNDKGVFQFDSIWIPLKQLFTSKNNYILSESETKQYNYFKKYEDSKLVEIVKKQQEFDLDKKPKEIALRLLLNRIKSLKTLENKGLVVPMQLKKSKAILKDYSDYSNTALLSFGIGALLLILHFVFKNNKLPQVAEASLSLSIMAFIFYIIYYIIQTKFYRKFYKTFQIKKSKLNIIWFILAIPFFPLHYIIAKNKMKQHFYLSCLKTIK